MTDSTVSPPAPTEKAAADYLFQLSTGCMVSSALQVVTRLQVADHLADGPRSIDELASATGTHADALYRVLRALASVGVFEEISPRRFGLNQPSELLRRDIPGPRSMVLWMTDPFHFKVYAEALYSVQTGRPAVEKTHGMPVFECFSRDPELSEVFNDAMTTLSAMVIPAVLDTYDFSDAGVLVDIAGGHGRVLLSILEKHPQVSGVLFDLDHVIAGARPKIAAAGLEDRCRTESGDFFKTVPEGDTYVMKHIIHDWDDERAIQILRNIRTAMKGRPDGRVVLIESVLPPGNSPDFGKLIDVEMLLLPGGRERTADEFRALFGKAGFEMTRIIPNGSPLSAIEATVTW
jgi:hypothetical protein